MTRRTIAVVSSGLREPSSTRLLADRLTAATVRELGALGVEADVEVVEVRLLAHDLTNMLLTGFAAGGLRTALDTVAHADGIIAVTPVFSGSYSGLFKNFFDVTEQGALAGTPVLLGATAGTPRHSLAIDHAMRPLFAYLRALTVPTGVFAATADFGATSQQDVSDESGALDQRVDRGARELAALVAAREPRTPSDPFAAPTSFEDLLRGL
ncbi:FMN reductase [Cellulomonas chengniuliangii]|uniref:FMN reductase n=1 Tax=Cellulomonas chengniuliangii TaxID=2968084 RepID=A0ABY5KVP7_9CELL|nr:FMN reductase [Cellulomonas chengniuliangii]MCC2310007.1 FMN reductase [Cellulomonas chengniuliangii]MCC2317009.1 FMN reductase [Cellulomonas chengniuliangii]UUI74596.1 FMN reductase [Cellulomonas chengniuliangii]